MGGQLDGNFLAGSLPHKFIILIVTSFICLWSINFSLFLSVRCISSHDNRPSVWPRAVGRIWSDDDDGSGVAGPLAARGGGQICRPFVL